MMLTTVDVIDLVSHGNVRVEVGNVDTLADSIAEHGMIQPPIVVATDDESGSYVIVAGHRRIAAAKQLGLSMIDVIIDDPADASEIIAIQYHENMERLDLTPYEQAQVAWDLKTEGLNQDAVAKAMGIPKAQVATMQKTAKHLADVKPASATQLSAEGLFDVVANTTPQQAGDVVALIVDGVHYQSAIRKIEREYEIIEFYDEIGEYQKQWADMGVTVVTGEAPDKDLENPNEWGTGYARLKNVKKLRDLGIDEANHIELECHVVWIHADASGWQTPSVSHWCVDAKSHTPTKSRTPELVSPEAVKTKALQEKSSVGRKADRDAKNKRIAQSDKWMKTASKASDRELFALDRAIETWRHDHTRAAIKMLGLLSDRPTGALLSWYDDTLKTYLDDKFGDNTLKRDRWKVKFLIAYQYIEDGWMMDAGFMSMLQDVEVPDA